SPPSQPVEGTAKAASFWLRPDYRTGRDRGYAVDVDRVAGRAEADQRSTLAIGTLDHRALHGAVDGQLVTLGNGEVLDGEKSAVCMEHIGIVAATTSDIELPSARRE